MPLTHQTVFEVPMCEIIPSVVAVWSLRSHFLGWIGTCVNTCRESLPLCQCITSWAETRHWKGFKKKDSLSLCCSRCRGIKLWLMPYYPFVALVGFFGMIQIVKRCVFVRPNLFFQWLISIINMPPIYICIVSNFFMPDTCLYNECMNYERTKDSFISLFFRGHLLESGRQEKCAGQAAAAATKCQVIVPRWPGATTATAQHYNFSSSSINKAKKQQKK